MISNNLSEADITGEAPHAVDQLRFAAVSALLHSRHFETIHFQPYRGSDDEVIRHLGMTDDLVSRLQDADLERFAEVVKAIDALMLENLNVQEVRAIIKVIARRDVRLFRELPAARRTLMRTMNAIECSALMEPERLRRIALDVKRYRAAMGEDT